MSSLSGFSMVRSGHGRAGSVTSPASSLRKVRASPLVELAPDRVRASRRHLVFETANLAVSKSESSYLVKGLWPWRFDVHGPRIYDVRGGARGVRHYQELETRRSLCRKMRSSPKVRAKLM
jgi:hypothetical protein